MENPGFKFLKEAFDKFANKYSAEDMAGRVVRSVAAGGKAAVDQGLQEFPKTFINEMAKDLYSMVTSQEVADGISATARSFDEEKVKEMLDGMVMQMKDQDTALRMAKQVKDLLAKASPDDIEAQIDGLMSMGDIPLSGRMVFIAFFSQIKPIMNDMKNASDEEVAAKIVEIADQIPTEAIAAQVGALTREITPERVSKQAHDLVGQLPSPQAIADLVHGVGTSASKHLERMTKISAPSEVSDILRDFAENASDLVSKTLEQDKEAKKTFNKKGQDFDL